MQVVYYFDICAVLIFVILGVSLFVRKMTQGVANRILMVFLVIAMLTAVCSMLTLFGRAGILPSYVTLRYVLHSLYFLFRNCTGPLYILFIVALTDTWHRFRRQKVAFLLFLLPYFIVLASVAVNPIFHQLFYINDRLEYIRGDYFLVMYLVAGFYMIVGFGYLTFYRKLFHLGRLIALYAQFPLTALALLVQWRWPQLPVEMLAMALAFLLLMLVVQRLDDSVDIFTGLRNYVTYTEDMKRNFITGKCVGVILVNISNYESLFSMLGFDLQAEMLKQISHRLSEINSRFRCHADLYYLDRARYRLVFNTKYKEKAEKAAEAINRELKQGMVLDQFELDLLAFVSVMNCPEDIPNFKSLMRFGNEFSKLNHYSGRVMHFSDIVANNRFSLTNELDIIIENALLEKKFEIYYQPIYSVKENYFASAEALLRLKDEQYGSISPSDFIPAAEKSGAIHRIGDYVMEEVCRFVSSEEFKELNLEYIEVNLSVVQCMQIGMAERILRIMEKYQVPPERINLEITETAAGYAQNSMMENMDKLSGAGIAFSLDDYGIGYSNIKRVVSLPLKMIKLDKAFVDEKENPKMWVVLQNTIKMIREMEMQIVVEGVETEELVQQFTDMDCDYIQGYYYSKPIPKLEFIEFIRREHAK